MALEKHIDSDVVIVGGGAIGAVLALELDRLNYSVAVIELRTPTFASSDPERVVALNDGSRCYLESLGLWKEIEELGLGDIHHIVVTEPGNRGRFDLHASDLQSTDKEHALGYVVEMGHLLEPMYRALQASSVELIAPACIENFELLEDQVSIQMRRGDEQLTISSALLLGADGTYSQMRAMAGIDVFGWDYNRFGLVASVTTERGHQETAHECFRSSGPLAFLPLADGRFSIVWAATPAEATQLLAMDDEAFIYALQKAAGASTMSKLGAVTSVSKRASFPLELTIAKSFAQSRLALLGNAAHTIHPVAGQGMNLGFRDVETLIEVLSHAKAQQGDAYCDPGQSILMQAYAENRRGDVMAVAGFTESMSHIFGSSVPGVKWLRGMGLDNLSRVPALADLLLQQASGLAQFKQFKRPEVNHE
ncbi:MAG: FAD-dependent oxidoreductase [Mariprofundus sp.]|nr:FAD-dependent oxidoreductase [Mariprofundus sp.]